MDSLNRPTIANIEAGRRGFVTVDEVLTLAYVLGVSPASLLFPESGSVLVTPTTPIDDPESLRRWVRGSDPLPGMDPKSYRDQWYAKDVLIPVAEAMVPEVKKMVEGAMADLQERLAVAEELAARMDRIEQRQAAALSTEQEGGGDG